MVKTVSSHFLEIHLKLFIACFVRCAHPPFREDVGRARCDAQRQSHGAGAEAERGGDQKEGPRGGNAARGRGGEEKRSAQEDAKNQEGP